ncbi:MAG: beta-ketoacyl-ACP synthase [Hyphomicrobium sp.]|uniref:beta-ketoacyl-ACP synthase n=1 Tax=Hyphomicrobium sp. TaxID=82 RepID=UPI0013282CAC|nr:beta-ketoacyl-ACP synthase [Hyphomicrobium sp.]KAB2943143.1 MAG: beta-ketoacyl-ACP synthase [Hyphomicrobium sp.]MBZ0209037.1 beta-ketoacyl-ACP synthase [Hyphomicrobium sp.]
MAEQAWITGIGLVSSLGQGAAEHWRKLGNKAQCRPVTDELRFPPYCVHPLAPLDFAKQIPRTSDQRQMERWQRIGVYAAGLALEDANLAGNAELLDKTNLCIAAGNGERDLVLDARVLEVIDSAPSPGATLNRELMTGLRPTLYLGQLSNLLAGNISIIHGATGSSRTFKGEEMAGVAAIADAVDRIEAGQGDLFLVGGALNAEREDLLLNCELATRLYAGPFRSVWERSAQDGGLVLGSLGAFLVIEAASHARAREVEPYARVAGIRSDRSRRDDGQAASTAARLLASLGIAPTGGKLGVLSGASGAEPITAAEIEFLDGMKKAGFYPLLRAWGSVLGHSLEAHFIAGMALAAMSVCEGTFYPPFDQSGRELAGQARPDGVLVTAFGHWRGEGLGLVVPVQ